jgi:hypothetical protein
MPVVFVASGPTVIRCAVFCDEGDRTEQQFEVQVPTDDEYRRRLGVQGSGLGDEQLAELKQRVLDIIRETPTEEEQINSAEILERLSAAGVYCPDYAIIEVLNQLDAYGIKLHPHARRSEIAIRQHGGVFLRVNRQV